MSCECDTRRAWLVSVPYGNYSWFSGGSARNPRKTPSAYSEVVCALHRGGCGRHWRTKAKYVAALEHGDDCPFCRGTGERVAEIDDDGANLGFRVERVGCDMCGGSGRWEAR